MNRQHRRSAARHDRSRRVAALGSAAVLASAGVGAAVVLSGSEAGAAAATFTVDQLSDDGTGGTTGSLSWAIQQANANPGQDTIDFSVTGTISVTGNLPQIYEAVSITGPGASALTIDGGGTKRLLDFVGFAGGTDTVSGLTLTGGYNVDGGGIRTNHVDADLVLSGMVITGNVASTDGGGVSLYGTGHVLIVDSQITNNYAHDDGGGLYLWNTNFLTDADFTVTITNSTISGNTSYSDGGAVWGYAVTLGIVDSTLADNAAYIGAVHLGAYSFHSSLAVTGSHITGNTASGEGSSGLQLENGTTATVAGSEISGNHTAFYGGAAVVAGASALYVIDSTVNDNVADHDGGAFYVNDSSSLFVVRSTVSGNAASDGGGGAKVVGASGFATLDSTWSGNTAGYYGGALYLNNSGQIIVAQSTISGNSAAQAGGIYGAQGIGIQMAQSTITGNKALDPGNLPKVGGIQIGGGDPILTGARAEAHSAHHAPSRVATPMNSGRVPERGHGVAPAVAPGPGHVEMSGTIVAANNDDDNLDLGAAGATIVHVAAEASIIGSIQSPNVVVTDAGGTRSGVTAAALLLGPLADNGGPTKTHALLPGSPAIDAGPATVTDFPGNEYDQRGEGYPRVVNGKVDVGAFEVQPPPDPEPTFTG